MITLSISNLAKGESSPPKTLTLSNVWFGGRGNIRLGRGGGGGRQQPPAWTGPGLRC